MKLLRDNSAILCTYRECTRNDIKVLKHLDLNKTKPQFDARAILLSHRLIKVLNAIGSLWVARLHLRKPAGQHHEIVNTMRGLCYNGDKSHIVMDYLISMQLVHFGLPNCMQGGLQGNTMKELMELGRLTYLNLDQYGSWKVNSYNVSSWDPIQKPCQLMNRLPHCPYQMA